MVAFSQHPDEINQLRSEVSIWLHTGLRALLGCRDQRVHHQGFFLGNAADSATDADKDYDTTARAFTALMRVDQTSTLADIEELKTSWQQCGAAPMNSWWTKDSLTNVIKSLNEYDPKDDTDNLRATRYAELMLAAKYFANKCRCNGDQELLLRKASIQSVRDRIEELMTPWLQAQQAPGARHRGQFPLDNNDEASRHYFVTLQFARANYRINVGISGLPYALPIGEDQLYRLTGETSGYCTQQSFFAEREIQYKHDAVQHAMATVLYCVYDTRADPELCTDFLRAIARSQLSNGSWPATHPIIRKNRPAQLISSHEVALALTLVYYQPQVPDSAREVLLDVLERYFRRWVVQTYLPRTVHKIGFRPSDTSPPDGGWFDDHTVAPYSTEGWATATVVQFLANYRAILNDHLNRRVIDVLGVRVQPHVSVGVRPDM